MYAVAVLDSDALESFRREHPWLGLPPEVCEVSVYFDDNGGPTRLTAMAQSEDGTAWSVDVEDFGIETVLALIRYAPQGRPTIDDCPEEARVRDILETLPMSDRSTDSAEIERQRTVKLEQAYEMVRQIAIHRFKARLQARGIAGGGERIEACLASIPSTLDAVEERHKPLFLEVELWRLVAVLRDEFSLPADSQIPPQGETAGAAGGSGEQSATSAMADPVIQALFDFSPVAFSISSTGEKHSRYVRVNQAYLDLVGKTWDEIRGSEMISSGVVVGSEARNHRLALLDRDGGYDDQIVEIRIATGEIIPVQISARRLSLGGQLYDFEILTRLNEEE
ncbi:hypothetical protein M8R20_04880 [Pseudomonas sp. R2.Fl]|nr:hypothetical protein [Pseudomonas sp. R2.Fl]